MEVVKCKVLIGNVPIRGKDKDIYQAYKVGNHIYAEHKVACRFINDWFWKWSFNIVEDAFIIRDYNTKVLKQECKRIMLKGHVYHVYELPLQEFAAHLYNVQIPKKGRPKKSKEEEQND